MHATSFKIDLYVTTISYIGYLIFKYPSYLYYYMQSDFPNFSSNIKS